MNKVKISNGKKGGVLEGPSHANGGIKAVVVDDNRPIEVEGGEVIINKHAAKKHWKELSKINQSAGNGVAIHEPQFKKGGQLTDIQQKKFGKVMHEFKEGDLRSGSKHGQKVTDRKQAIAIAYSEAKNVHEEGGNLKAKNKEVYKKWKQLVNMSYAELEKFYNSEEGKEAGLSKSEADSLGISNGRESAKWILKMKKTKVDDWTLPMWRWANKQISFISRMSGVKGDLYDDKGNKTRKHLALLIWGHNPNKKENGGSLTYKEKYNRKYDYDKNESHDLKEISEDTGVSKKGLQQIYNKGVGAYKTNPQSVRSNVHSKEQWAMGRVYSAVMGGKASKIDAKELKMSKGGNADEVIVYHGTTRKFNKFDSSKLGEATKSGDTAKSGFWFTDDISTAKSYARAENERKVDELLRSNNVKEAQKLENDIANNKDSKYLKTIELSYKKPFVIDAEGVNFHDYEDEIKDAIKIAKSNGNDVLIVKNLNDNADYSEYTPATHYCVFDNSIIKENKKDIKFATGGLIAPNGKKSNLTDEQYKLVRTPEFKAWFGDWENDPANASKVVDENGEPLVVYHGTKDKFFVFDLIHFGKTDMGFFGKGFYFTPNKETAETYASISEWDRINDTYNVDGIVLSCFLNLKNPIIISTKSDFINASGKREIREGYDGKIVIPNSFNSPNTEFIAFESTQIKLADGTNTTFNKNKDDIRFDEGGNADKKIVYHGGDEKITKMSSEFIKGGVRANLGYGVYFASTIYKAKTYGKEITLLDIAHLNFLDLNKKIDESFISQIKSLKEEETNSIFDTHIMIANANYYSIAKEFSKHIGDTIWNGWLYWMNTKSTNSDKFWANTLLKLGYDGVQQGDYEYCIFNFDKANKYLIEDNSDKFDEGGKIEKLYTIRDFDNDIIEYNITEQEVINFVNTLFHYDMEDEGAEEISSLEEAKQLLKTIDYKVI